MLKSDSRKFILILAIAAILSTSGYVLWSRSFYQIGYPLDDSWIYQTYARNLSQFGEWSFIPGEISGGSTGPLWVLFLTIGYWLRLDHHLWAFLFGTVILFLLGVVGGAAVKSLYPQNKSVGLLAGLMLVFEWHLVWASVSGMETILAALLVTSTLVFLFKPEISAKDWFLIGFVVGVSIWVRPDSILLIGPIGFVLVFGSQSPLTKKFKHSVFVLLGLMIPVGLYLLFNQIVSGSVWPNTFYAKQAEYAAHQNIPITTRYGQQLVLPLIGAGITLFPGFIFAFLNTIKARNWALFAAFVWFFGYLAVFAWRLPVTYQHGRYIIPAMPIYFILGSAGTFKWCFAHWHSEWLIFRVLSKVWSFSCVSVTILFGLLGAKAYAEDVAIIESEMVTTARWIHTNTDSNALIAAHDIGALGYFSERQIIDLAGLISPDVIPFIRDERQLAVYLDEKEADYLMTFPDWYPILISGSKLIFQTNGVYSPNLGGENMAVYEWESTNVSK